MGVELYDFGHSADLLEKSMDMFGIKDAFLFFGITTKREWIKQMNKSLIQNDFAIDKNGKIIMPNLGII